MNEPQILKHHQNSKETQITNDLEISRETKTMNKPQIL